MVAHSLVRLVDVGARSGLAALLVQLEKRWRSELSAAGAERRSDAVDARGKEEVEGDMEEMKDEVKAD